MQRVPRAGARRGEDRTALARQPVRKLKKLFAACAVPASHKSKCAKLRKIFLHPSAAAGARCVAATHDADATSVRLAAFLTGTSRMRDGCIALRRAAADRERAFAAPPQRT
ncbi:hypothetical protein ACFQGW_05800 [Xanthomonas theicola]|uniref:hypothetical protein n=1 Tax=Xanthomonas theicola TaxID=56464 RepID=UPI003623403C